VARLLFKARANNSPPRAARARRQMDPDFLSWLVASEDLFAATEQRPAIDLSGVISPRASSPANSDVSATSDDDDDDDGDEHGGGKLGKRRSSASSDQPGGKHPRTSVDEGDLDREQKLERNREIARNCRRRKKERLDSLQSELNRLNEFNTQLELKLSSVSKGASKEELRKRELEEISKACETVADAGELRTRIQQYKEIFSDFGRDRKAAITFHLDQLKVLLLPNQVSKMTLWLLQQDDDFYDEEKNQTTFDGGIWNLVVEALGLSIDQKRTLLSMRPLVRAQGQQIGEGLRLLKSLEQTVGENTQSMAAQMSRACFL